ncbi:peptide-methionine (R)-S-oxide reductase MsrB [Galbibacter mesophilus]|uniref:peptide-methionine (R)-S-oxide reductase MsrB n=1 Tax=Galbibacter mesophilus TaxID=379069 RepID=UPI00191C9337|nr:peptide-methionine (R)-S-oxide reductase MsrB [Galbibacter mesophilus]MCM5662920.1 peptide-methionine (R)-S-oxide reductase MsrB [Galbibacter mesophilus]
MRTIFLSFLCIAFLSCNSKAQNKSDNKTTKSAKSEFPISKTEAEWKAELTDAEFYVLRKAGTERPFTSDLLEIKQKGTYVCAACGTPLFKSEHKFDSGTGWPSFDRAIEGNVAYGVDNKIGVPRDEEHCANCGGHLGHVFDDGPSETTGKRHCINGVALDFVPES